MATFRSIPAGVYAALLLAFSLGAMGDEPPLPANAIFKPSFLFLDDSFCAGTAFILTGPGGKKLLLTPDHLFGPDGGLNAQMSPADIASQVCGVVGLSMEDQSSICTAGKYAGIADAAPLESGAEDKDLAVFYINQTPGAAFSLSDTDPKVGDRVWMYARLRGTTKVMLYPATVSVADGAKLHYIFDGHPDPLNGTSGAPVLDAKGKVVGMNLGGGQMTDKRVFGIANPVWALRKEIAAYVK